MLLRVDLGDAMVVNIILGYIFIKDRQLVIGFDPPLIRSKVLMENFAMVYVSTKRMAITLLLSNVDPASVSNAQAAVLKTVCGEEQKSTVQLIVDNVWGQHK